MRMPLPPDRAGQVKNYSRSLVGICLVGILTGVLLLEGCRSVKPGPTTKADDAQRRLTFTIQDPGQSGAPVTVSLDGQTLFSGPVSRGGTKVMASVSQGWHQVRTTTGNKTHQGLVEADRDKWILIRREPGKAEGFGFHVTDFNRKN